MLLHFLPTVGPLQMTPPPPAKHTQSRGPHWPNDSKGWEFLQVKGEIHSEIGSEESSDGVYRIERPRIMVGASQKPTKREPEVISFKISSFLPPLLFNFLFLCTTNTPLLHDLYAWLLIPLPKPSLHCPPELPSTPLYQPPSFTRLQLSLPCYQHPCSTQPAHGKRRHWTWLQKTLASSCVQRSR